MKQNINTKSFILLCVLTLLYIGCSSIKKINYPNGDKYEGGVYGSSKIHIEKAL